MSALSIKKTFWEKFREKGLLGSCKALGRKIHYHAFKTPWDFELIPSLLVSLDSRTEQVVIVQIGANVGDTTSDPLYRFLQCRKDASDSGGRPPPKAILVEPVPGLFYQLSLNYKDVPGVSLENIAITDSPGVKNFYGLRPGIDLAAHGLPAWSYQLGSFLPGQIESFMVLRPDDPDLRTFVEKNIISDPFKCETLTRLCDSHSLSKIDFLQVDTEGYDYRVLLGLNFEKLLPRYINYERIHLKHEEPACRRLLTSKGYILYDHGQDTLATWSPKVPTREKLKEWVYCKWLEMIF